MQAFQPWEAARSKHAALPRASMCRAPPPTRQQSLGSLQIFVNIRGELIEARPRPTTRRVSQIDMADTIFREQLCDALRRHVHGLRDQADAQPHAQPDVRPDVQPDVQPSVRPDAQPDAPPDVQPDVQPDVRPGAQPDSEQEWGDADFPWRRCLRRRLY